jgi:hypothetical protein
VTEHQLQKRLTQEWANNGVPSGSERLFLAAWEVMDNYRINSAQHGFGRPAIDFLLLDRSGRLVAVELKMQVQTALDSWAVLCQVTHRAHLLAAAFSPERLRSAYELCHSGQRGRVDLRSDVEDLEQAHARFFGVSPLPKLPGVPIRRVVAAPVFGASWPTILEQFSAGPREALDKRLERYSGKTGPGREIGRWLDLPADSVPLITPGVAAFAVSASAVQLSD